MKVRYVIQISEGYTTAVEMSRELERKIDHTPSLTQDEILQVRGHPLCIALSFTFKQKFTMPPPPPPPPPLPLSLSISAGVHNWIIFTSVPATSSGSKEAKTDIKSYRKRKKNTCMYPTILCQRCPNSLSCDGGVLILCPVMEVS